MATGSSVRSTLQEISAKHLECSICTDRFKQPKVLDCQHSFCWQCLVKYRDGRYPRATKIPCPVCRQETILPQSGIQGLKSNFHLAGLIGEFELQEKVACSAEAKLLCQVCDKGNEAGDHCLDCEMNICMDCCKTHKQFPILKNHIIASFDDIRQGKVKVTKQPDEHKCHKHKEGVKQFYCKKCDELICQGCTVLDHPTATHDITDTGTASREYRQSLQKDLPALGRDIQGLELSLRETTAAKKMVNDNTAKARKGVQDRTAEVIAKVKAEEKQLLDEITTQGQKQNKRLDVHEKALSNMLQRKKHSLQASQEVASNASDSDFLSLYPVIKKDMDNLRGQPAPKAAGFNSHPVFVKSQMLDIDLGKVMVELEDTWEMCQSFGKQGQGEGEFEGARGIAAAADPDEIAVADWKNKRVVICDKQGKTKCSISVISADVKALSDGWVVASQSVVKVYKRDRTLADEFRTVADGEAGETGVHIMSLVLVNNGNIIAGDKARKVLTEHQPGHKGKLIRTIPVSLRPSFLAVLSNGWIVISDREKGLVGIVDVSDGKAAEVATIRPTIGGKPVKSCRGVCSNSSGIYLVVITDKYHTGHIHHYNCAGQFVSCVAQGLYNPQGITFTADGQQLAVADWHSVKIYHKV